MNVGDSMRCNKCGMEIENGLNICSECGEGIIDTEINAVDNLNVNYSRDNTFVKKNVVQSESVNNKTFMGIHYKFWFVVTSFPINILVVYILFSLFSTGVFDLLFDSLGPLWGLILVFIFIGIFGTGLTIAFIVFWIMGIFTSFIQVFIKKSDDRFWKWYFFVNAFFLILIFVFLLLKG